MSAAGAVCWGFSGCCGQFLFEERGVQAPWLVTIRLVVAGIFLIINGFIVNGTHNLDIFRRKADWTHLALFGLAGITFCQYSYFMAVQSSNAGTATVLQYLSPVLILLWVCLRGKRLPGKMEVLAIALSLLGVFLIGTHGNLHGLQLTGEGLFWGLMAAVAAMIYTVLPGTLVNRFGICQVLGFGMLMGGLFLSIFVRPWNVDLAWDGELLAALFGVVIVGTALAFGLYLKGVSLIGPLKGSLISGLEPVSSILISVLWLGTAFAVLDFAGFALILAAVGILAGGTNT